MTEEEKQYLASLPGFAREVLRFGDDIYPRMAEIFARIDANFLEAEPEARRVNVKTCNGAGKTTRMFPGVAFWIMSVFPRAKVIYTTASGTQLSTQFWPALTKFESRFEGWEFLRGSYEVKAPNGSRLKGFVTNEAGRAEGHHGNKDLLYELSNPNEDGPLVILIDEAKTVPDFIYDAFDRCTYQLQLSESSPGYAEGRFYEYFSTKSKGCHIFTVSGDPDKPDAPHLDHVKNRRLIEELGPDHPLVRSKVFAEFMDSPEGTIISLGSFERCVRNPPREQVGDRRAFCDFAAGGDENVIAERTGNRVQILKAWHESDTMRAVSQFIVEFKKARLSPSEIFGDNDGLGKVMIDALHDAGWPIGRVSNGSAANESDFYVNRAAETWALGAKAIEKQEIILPEDEKLQYQLTNRKLKASNAQKGRLQLESKQDMKKRGVGSPDRADAVLEAMRFSPRSINAVSSKFVIQPGIYTDREVDESVLAGINAGGY
ncbi:MAG: hypothetical protein AAFX93_14095 [Verrucomicrobiota bacterium]